MADTTEPKKGETTLEAMDNSKSELSRANLLLMTL